jgi:hypothetical protein
LYKNIGFKQYQELRNISFIKKNKNKNGFIFVEKEKRLTPFGLLANSTIGLSREYVDGSGNLVTKNVGLEKTYGKIAILDIDDTPISRAWHVVALNRGNPSPSAEAFRYFVLEHGAAIIDELYPNLVTRQSASGA